ASERPVLPHRERGARACDLAGDDDAELVGDQVFTGGRGRELDAALARVLLVHREGGPAVDLLDDVCLGPRDAHLGGGGLETVADPDAPGAAAEDMDGSRHVAS